MSAIRLLARAAAATGLAIGATVVLVGVTTGPAAAADASCQLSRLPSRMSVGGNGAQIAGQVRSSDREVLDVVQILWRIRLNDLSADQVSLSGIDLSEEDEEVRGTEQLRSVGPFGRTVAHTLRFGSGAQPGRATVTMTAFIRDNGEFKEACSQRVTTSVQGVRGTPTPSLAPTPLETGLAEASQSPPVAAAAPPPARPADSDSALWPLYLLGLLLVAGGGGIVALLLLRRPREDDEAPVYEPAYVAGYDTPGHGAPAPGHGAPAPGHGAPAPGHGAPAPGYGAPAPGYGAPAPGYGAPAPGYGAPVPGYGARLADAGFGTQPAYHGYGAPPPHPTHALPPPVDPFGPPSDAPTAIIPTVDDEDRHPDGRHRGGGPIGS